MPEFSFYIEKIKGYPETRTDNIIIVSIEPHYIETILDDVQVKITYQYKKVRS